MSLVLFGVSAVLVALGLTVDAAVTAIPLLVAATWVSRRAVVPIDRIG